MNFNNLNKKALLIGACAVLVLIVLLAALGGKKNAAPVASDTADGIAYLEMLEQKDPATVENILRERREAELAAQREALLEELYSGERDVWPLFEGSVILGDSRAVGFYYYDFLPKSHVLAAGGDTIRNVESHIEELKTLNPTYIFLCYGLNDVSIGFWDLPEEYAAEMMEVVSKLNVEIPNAKVIISSILPATDPAFDLSSKWRNIPQFSAAVESACEENGVIFVNNDKISAEHMDLWQPDGIHLQIPFYNYWGSNLIIAALEATGNEAAVTGEEAEHET